MKNTMIWLFGLVLIGIVPLLAYDEEPRLDSRVVKIELPVADVKLSYVEARPQMLVKISAGTTTVEGVRFFVGDGKIAVPLEADPLNGIRFQKNQKLTNGHRFEKYSIVELESGYSTVDELKPGDVYIVFQAVNFVSKK
jgi:hypothetical protein